MGSMAQDERHERLMQEARDDVYHLQRRVDEKRKELVDLEKELEEAEQHLRMMNNIDMERD